MRLRGFFFGSLGGLAWSLLRRKAVGRRSVATSTSSASQPSMSHDWSMTIAMAVAPIAFAVFCYSLRLHLSQRSRHRLRNEATNEDDADLNQLQRVVFSNWRRRRGLLDFSDDDFEIEGLSDADVASIPVEPFRFQEGRDVQCSICLEMLREGEQTKKLAVCRHVFHFRCLDSWLRCSASCPLCRQQVHIQTS